MEVEYTGRQTDVPGQVRKLVERKLVVGQFVERKLMERLVLVG